LPEYFSRHGYTTLSRGKISHAHKAAKGADLGQWMFDVWEKADGKGPVNRATLSSRDLNLVRGKPGPPSKYIEPHGSPFSFGVVEGPTSETKDYRTAQWAADQLQAAHDKPFFLAVGLSKPHLPFYSPQEFWDLYPEDGDYAPEIREDDLDDILSPDGKPRVHPSMDYLWLKQNGLINECARAYLACCSYADHCLGVIFDSLRTSPHADNTVVILWGDHGWHLGEKLRYRKAALWTESTRAPMMIRLPGMAQRQDCHRAVNHIDFYPTLIDLCGLPAKPELDGRSLVPLLENPAREWFPTLTVAGAGNVSIHDERWNFIRYDDGTEQLYDLENDPMEWTNLAAHPEHSATLQRMSALLPAQFAASVPKADKAPSKQSSGKLDESIRPQRVASELR
jgi:arylsulfatase A-like enzyme